MRRSRKEAAAILGMNENSLKQWLYIRAKAGIFPPGRDESGHITDESVEWIRQQRSSGVDLIGRPYPREARAVSNVDTETLRPRTCQICHGTFTAPKRAGSLSIDDNHTRICSSCRRAALDAKDGTAPASEAPAVHNGASSVSAAPMRQVVFDLETWGLDRGWGVTMIGCFLIHGDPDGPRRVTLRQRDSEAWKSGRRSDDREMAAKMFDILRDCHIGYAHNGCVSPEQRVLTSDLRWVPAGELKPGDVLASFESDAEKRHRKWGKGVVERSFKFRDRLFDVRLEDGTILRANGRHPLLVGGGHGKALTWRRVDRLTMRRSDATRRLTIPRLIPTWSEPSSYESGWLAGFFDGEGCLSQSGDWGQATKLSASQVDGPVLRQAECFLRKAGFDFGVYQYDPQHRHVMALSIRGGKGEVARFLGGVRPLRLLGKFSPEFFGTVKGSEPIPLGAVEDAGVGWVQGLQVSGGTYVVEGFGSHNSNFDVRWLRTVALKYGLDMPRIKLVDPCAIAWKKYLIGRNSLEAVADFLGISEDKAGQKVHLSPDVWRGALMDDSDEAWAQLVERCESDVEILNRIAARVTRDVGMVDYQGSWR